MYLEQHCYTEVGFPSHPPSPPLWYLFFFLRQMTALTGNEPAVAADSIAADSPLLINLSWQNGGKKETHLFNNCGMNVLPTSIGLTEWVWILNSFYWLLCWSNTKIPFCQFMQFENTMGPKQGSKRPFVGQRQVWLVPSKQMNFRKSSKWPCFKVQNL